jgi:hypothetical protein
MRIGRGNRSIRRRPAPMPHCPPQIPHDLTWDWTRAAAVGTNRLSYDTISSGDLVFSPTYLYISPFGTVSCFSALTCSDATGRANHSLLSHGLRLSGAIWGRTSNAIWFEIHIPPWTSKNMYENHSHNENIFWLKYLINTERFFTPNEGSQYEIVSRNKNTSLVSFREPCYHRRTKLRLWLAVALNIYYRFRVFLSYTIELYKSV